MSLFRTAALAASVACASVATAAVEAIAFEPSAFLEVAVGDPMPRELMGLDVREMKLASRQSQHGGVFYVFEDPANEGLHATLLLREGRLTGSVYGHGTQIAVIRPVESGFSTVDFVDGADRAPCACHAGGLPNVEPGQSRRATPPDGGIAGVCDTGAFVDVLLVYTNSAVAEAGGAQQVEDAIAWAMADANLALATSQTGTQFRVAGVQHLSAYAEAASMVDELNRMQAGQIDGLSALRDATNADLVAMVTRGSQGICGVAFLLPDNDSSASNAGFSVSALQCLPTRVLTHELGHNFGCGHAPIDPSPVGIFAYSRGHNFTAGGIAYGTALAYTGQIIPRFSNPAVAFNGQPTGISAQRNNALTIATTKLAVSNFRCDGEGVCGGPGSCYNGSPSGPLGCSNAACCASVCAQRPECCAIAWDANCATLALTVCTDCGEPSAGSCFEPRATPSCADASCCVSACIADAFCCDVAWDANCASFASAICAPQCGDAESGSCYAAHPTPNCADAACCSLVCATDPSCCSQAWDASCAAAATELCAGCGNPSAGSCLVAHPSPYCADLACCQQLCSSDEFCCSTQWDSLCAEAALVICSPCGGSSDSCLVAQKTPGCADFNCCIEVCSIDITCCEAAWDSACVKQAAAACIPKCGDAGAGSCFSAHATPSCDDATCCSAVCAVDASCCDSAWDKSCAALASGGLCQQPACGDPRLQPCSQSSTGPFCQNAQCCEAVCAAVPSCCEISWDENCVIAAGQLCAACSTSGDCDANGVPDECESGDCNQNGLRDNCEIASGAVADANDNGVPDECECIGDLDGNGSINAADLAGILNAWGPATGENAAADLDGNGVVNAADLASLLNAWGLCPNAVGDEAATAINIAPGASATFSTIFKTPSADPPANGTCQFLQWTPTTRDIWFRVQTGAGGQLGVNLCDSSYDTSMVIYSVSSLGALTRIACDDDSCQPTGPLYQSRINGLAVSGTVLIRIGGYEGSAGSGVIRVTIGP
jgi:hypothetical protein